MSAQTDAKPNQDQRLEKKWSVPLIKAGYTVIPNAILLRQQALGLDAIDLNILLLIASYWWDSDRPPYPSKMTIAKAMHIHVTTVRRRLAALEKGGLIKRNHRKNKLGGNNTNSYDFGPLIASALPYATEMIVCVCHRTERYPKSAHPSV